MFSNPVRQLYRLASFSLPPVGAYHGHMSTHWHRYNSLTSTNYTCHLHSCTTWFLVCVPNVPTTIVLLCLFAENTCICRLNLLRRMIDKNYLVSVYVCLCLLYVHMLVFVVSLSHLYMREDLLFTSVFKWPYLSYLSRAHFDKDSYLILRILYPTIIVGIGHIPLLD